MEKISRTVTIKSKSRNKKSYHKKGSKNVKEYLTQEIKVEEQPFKCVINVNTTICKHKIVNKHIKSKSKKRPDNRIVPKCFRHVCSQQKRRAVHRRSSNKTCYLHNYKDNKTDKKSHKVTEKVLSKDLSKKHRTENKRKEPFKDDISYESLSTTSFSINERPTSYKHVNYMDEPMESKLDTLIRRAKERERQRVAQSRVNAPWYASPPSKVELASSEITLCFSDLNASIHSRSTLVLDMYDYKSQHETLNGMDPEALSYTPYSASSPIHTEEFLRKLPETEDFKYIKSEPTMDIEAYSPTMIECLEPTQFEIKTEHEIKKEFIDPKYDYGYIPINSISSPNSYNKMKQIKKEFY